MLKVTDFRCPQYIVRGGKCYSFIPIIFLFLTYMFRYPMADCIIKLNT